MWVGQAGSTRGRGGYARFKTLQEGHQSAVRDVEHKLITMSVEDVLTVWTPAEPALQLQRIQDISSLCEKIVKDFGNKLSQMEGY